MIWCLLASILFTAQALPSFFGGSSSWNQRDEFDQRDELDQYYDDREMRSAVIEGDVRMSSEQLQLASEGLNVDEDGPERRSISKFEKHKWPRGVVPYTLHKSVRNGFLNVFGVAGPSERAIKNAMKIWEEETCLKFVPRTKEIDFVMFTDEGMGKCNSWVGRQGGRQTISVGFACFKTGIMLHEIGHAVGKHHEQSRTDRDEFIEILWNNIAPEAKHNFKKYGSNIVKVTHEPYDYDSIMHYSDDAFASGMFSKTIKPKVRGVEIGQRDHLSQLDIDAINKYYNCPKK